MKNEIAMAIHPEFVEKIINGTKKYEYRRKAPKEKINKIYIYETKPKMKIIGEMEISEILCMAPTDIWKLTKSESGISKEYFFNYFKGSETAFAFKIEKVTVYKNPLNLECLGLKTAPQSYAFIKR